MFLEETDLFHQKPNPRLISKSPQIFKGHCQLTIFSSYAATLLLQNCTLLLSHIVSSIKGSDV